MPDALLLAGLVAVLLVAYVLLYYRFDRNVAVETERTATRLYESDVSRALVNGSGVNNIPSLALVTASPDVARANSCGDGPLFIGTAGDDSDCVRACVNATARAVHVADGETYTYRSTILAPGVHCTLGPRPECNMKTTVAMMTVNSVTCRTKFPRLVGGALGGDLVACNNAHINDPKNVLWDYLEDRRVDPWRSLINDEDELLPDGDYRYRCKFDGLDESGNVYQAHPYNRFHPIANYCAAPLYGAHKDVRTVFNVAGTGYECVCGDPAVTRVRNLVPGDPTSQCSDVSYGVEVDVKKRKRITVPYKCVTLFSPLADVGRYPICPEPKFLNRGSRMSSVRLEFTEYENELIEHPQYADFTGSNGAHTTKDKNLFDNE